MQGLADGYFVAPYTIGHHLASRSLKPVTTAHPKFKETLIEVRNRTERLLSTDGRRTVTEIHRQLGQIMWDYCGMARNAAGLQTAIDQIQSLREEFWKSVNVPGTGESFNQSLEYAGRLADFLEFGELLAKDALEREESAGGHFREEHQTADGEALRHDDTFAHVAAWEYNGDHTPETRHTEPLTFNEVELSTRSYK
jgi:succinate dehydrogenase / fumarate reductase flavoprotein subunit